MAKNRAFSGFYSPKKKSKYVGKTRTAFYRSSWERSFCKWCDENPKVIKWAIEPFELPYYDEGKGKRRKYNPDFWVLMEDGKRFLIEIKPDYETKPPKMKKETPKYLLQEATYITNISKWKAAEAFCEKKGWIFKVVTERTMEKMGIKLMKTLPAIKRKGTSKKNVKYANKTSSRRVKSKKRTKSCQ